MVVLITLVLFVSVLFTRLTAIQLTEGLTWFEAQKCCASRSGQLATIDDKIVSCNNIPPGPETLWTGNVRIHSEWIEFQGCYELNGPMSNHNNISECYQHCLDKQHNSFKFFSYKVNQCICNFVNTFRKTDDKKNSCLIESHANYSWVYKVLYNASYDGHGNCVASKCTNGSEKRVAERCTSLQIPMCGLSSDNKAAISSTTNWNKSRRNCKDPLSTVNNATDMCELNKDNVKAGMWTNMFRVEISSHVDHSNMIKMTDISSCVIAKCLKNIGNIKPKDTNCNETADAFFCKSAHNSTIMSSLDCKSQATNIYNFSKPYTIGETTVTSSVSRYKHKLSNRTQNHYSTEALTAVNTGVIRSVDVITTHKPAYTITNITPTMDQHVGNKPEATNIGLICGVTVGGVVLIAVIVIIACKMRKVGPFRKRPIYENTITMNSVEYAIPANYDTVLNTDNGSVPNVYINSDTGENQYVTID